MAGARNYKETDKYKLFMFSANQCSKPGCTNKMISDNDERILGQICHISAASPNGPRYRSDMDDDDRRSFDNLILLCYEHHKEIDDKNTISDFPAELLLEWKAKHIKKNKGKYLELAEETLRAPDFYWIQDYLMPDNFIGREDYIDILNQSIKKQNINKQSNIISLTGIGGTGKTCIVRKSIEDNKDQILPYKSIIWYSFAESKSDNSTFFFQSILKPIDPDFDTFIKEKKRKEDKGGFLSNKDLVNRVKEILLKDSILLVIDNLEVIQETSDESSKIYGEFKKGFKEIYNLFDCILNDGKSMVITTSRLELKKYKRSKGYKNIVVNAMTKEEGASLLSALGVRASHKDLIKFSEVLGNHPLCIKAAGIFMAEENISPESLIKNYLSNAFNSSEEGNKLIELLNLYRKIITKDQEHFLKMMSLHRRYITQNDFPLLLQDGFTEFSDADMLINIIKPLRNLNLIEQTISDKNETHYNCHPLVKFAYKTWFSDINLKKNYELLAESTKPDMLNLELIKNAEDVQPYFDTIYYYLEAKNYFDAYNFLMENFELFIRFKMYDETFKLLEIIEKAHIDKAFVAPFSFYKHEELGFINKLAYTCNDSQKEIEYNLKAIDIAKNAGDYFSLDQFIHITCGNYLDAGYTQNAVALFSKYSYDRSTFIEVFSPLSIEARIAFAKGEFKKAKSLYSKVYSKISSSNFVKDEIHARTRAIQKFAPILLANKSYKELEKLLLEDLELAITEGFSCCVTSIYFDIIDFYLDMKDVKKAELYKDRYDIYCEEYGVSNKEHKGLLCEIKEYDEAISLSLKDISTSDEEKFDKRKEIEALLILVAAYKGKKMNDEAISYYNKALDLMKKYEYYPLKLRLEQIFKN